MSASDLLTIAFHKRGKRKFTHCTSVRAIINIFADMFALLNHKSDQITGPQCLQDNQNNAYFVQIFVTLDNEVLLPNVFLVYQIYLRLLITFLPLFT